MKRRYNIAAHARRGGIQRWSSNFQPPPVKKTRKERASSVKAVVVVLASNRDGLHFPRQDVWHEWAKNSTDVGFAGYVEDHARFEQQCSAEEWSYWRPFLCPLQSSSAWGHFSLVLAELAALRWAKEGFAGAQWFYVVSGDSIPTKSVESFVQGPPDGASIVGFAEDLPPTVALNGWQLHEHSQWKVLSKKHVTLLVDRLVSRDKTLEEWKACAMEQKRASCCADVPDEWLIGSFLLRQEEADSVDWLEGTCIMMQTFVSARSTCCKREISHAKLLSRSEFRGMYREAWDDAYVFALRKVGDDECRKIRMS